MIELILLLSLTPAATQNAPVAQFKPCVWPNTCGKDAVAAPVVAQFRPCVWPNTCGAAVDEKI